METPRSLSPASKAVHPHHPDIVAIAYLYRRLPQELAQCLHETTHIVSLGREFRVDFRPPSQIDDRQPVACNGRPPADLQCLTENHLTFSAPELPAWQRAKTIVSALRGALPNFHVTGDGPFSIRQNRQSYCPFRLSCFSLVIGAIGVICVPDDPAQYTAPVISDVFPPE